MRVGAQLFLGITAGWEPVKLAQFFAHPRMPKSALDRMLRNWPPEDLMAVFLCCKNPKTGVHKQVSQTYSNEKRSPVIQKSPGIAETSCSWGTPVAPMSSVFKISSLTPMVTHTKGIYWGYAKVLIL